MAVDEVLLEAAAAGGAPALRLYGWRGPWLSIGYAQPIEPETLAACAAAGVRVVRRMTGGRAVLHGADLTYAIAAPDAALPEGLEASYRLVCDALLAALATFGVAAERAPAAAPLRPRAAFDCFESPAADEITARGRKLAGSAQRRAQGAVLQHGSIRLAPDPAAAAAAARLGSGATSLGELGVAPGAARRALVAELPTALARLLGAAVEPAALTASERAAARARAGRMRREPLARRSARALEPQGSGSAAR